MRIAIVTEVFLPKIDGITNRLRHTIRCLRRQGHEVLVLAPDAPLSDYAGAKVVGIPGVPFPPYPGLRLALPEPRIVWQLRRFRPDVVHAVGPAVLGLWGMLAARALALPIVASYHTDLPAYAKQHRLGWLAPAVWPLIRRVHNLADINLCPSTPTRRELQRRGVHSVGIWRGGVDCDRFHPRTRSLEMRMRLTDGRPDRPIVLYAGRLSPEKNLDVLRLVHEAAPHAHLALVGDGPGRKQLERSLEAVPATFTGFLRGEELASAFASADLFFMPSTTETLGFVVLEAMAAGVPVVAAEAGGIPDLVEHEENGVLYDPQRPLEGAAAAAALLSDEARRRQLAARGRKLAEQCDWDSETRGLVRSYQKAICVHAQTGLAGRIHRRLLRSAARS
jgi:glycosyltransferase involved in cell wall biosynthesis